MNRREPAIRSQRQKKKRNPGFMVSPIPETLERRKPIVNEGDPGWFLEKRVMLQAADPNLLASRRENVSLPRSPNGSAVPAPLEHGRSPLPWSKPYDTPQPRPASRLVFPVPSLADSELEKLELPPRWTRSDNGGAVESQPGNASRGDQRRCRFHQNFGLIGLRRSGAIDGVFHVIETLSSAVEER